MCVERWQKLFVPFFSTPGHDFSIDAAFSALLEVRGAVALKVVKTWLNGWATSDRMHEDPKLKCLLGCPDADDSQNHYVLCPHLFAFLKFLFDGISDDPLIRFGMKHPNAYMLKIISCSFSAYHLLKAKVRNGSIHMHEGSWTQPLLRQSWSVFANALCAEAGELRIPHRAFSLAQFIRLLCSGDRSCGPAAAIQDYVHQEPDH